MIDQSKKAFEAFQSTLPVGGATSAPAGPVIPTGRISIHAPRGGSDVALVLVGLALGFQSTLPVGGATTSQGHMGAGKEAFQSTLPVGGAT